MPDDKPGLANRGEIGIKELPIPEIDTMIFELAGQVDLFSYGKVKEVLNNWKENRKEKNLFFDLSQANYVASAGWAVMFNAAADAEDRGGRAVVYNMADRVLHSIQHLTAHRGMLTIAENENEAREIIATS